MKNSINNFAQKFQVIETEQLKKIVGGNGSVIYPLDKNKRKKTF